MTGQIYRDFVTQKVLLTRGASDGEYDTTEGSMVLLRELLTLHQYCQIA